MALQINIQRPTILAVDDTPDNLTVLSSLLKEQYAVKVATDGDTAIKIATAEVTPDLILLDILMRGMDGYEVCRRLKANPKTRDVPVIFLTALTDPHHEAKGLNLGAVDYVTKPISPPILMARIKNHLAFKASQDFLRDQAEYLAKEVARRTQEITAIQDATIVAMASLAESRDDKTANHIRRTQHYVRALADKLRTHARFGWYLSEDAVAGLFRTAPLHDIGNVAVPHDILVKPDKLTSEEIEVVKTHTTLGGNALGHAERALGTKVDLLKMAKEIALSHQERWDGSGYPEGMKGEDIPIAARLMAVADVYDALITSRPYKPAVPHDTAVAVMKEGRGTHFDPDILDAFLEIQAQFREIATRYPDRAAA